MKNSLQFFFCSITWLKFYLFLFSDFELLEFIYSISITFVLTLSASTCIV